MVYTYNRQSVAAGLIFHSSTESMVHSHCAGLLQSLFLQLVLMFSFRLLLDELRASLYTYPPSLQPLPPLPL